MREGWLLHVSLCALTLTACGQREHGSRPTLGSVPTASGVHAFADAAPEPPSAPVNWVEAIEREQWDVAARELDALSTTEKSRPEVTYVRARVALARGEAQDAVSLLEGLEGSLPLLAQDIAHWRAEAKSDVGPYSEAGEYFAARGTASALLRAAEAFERAKDVVRARALCNKVTSLDRTRLEEAAARACRIRLAEPADKSIATDARWIAVHAPDAPGVKEADSALVRSDPAHPLTGEELLLRAHVLADTGRTDEALRTLDRLSGAPAPHIARLDGLRARGDVLYRARSRHLEAARVLDECVQAGGPHAAEDAFQAARALSRAEHDDDAIYRMTQLAHSASGTMWGDKAMFFVPYLHLLHGQWKEAAKGFDEYAQKYPNGVEKKNALRDRALAHLLGGDAGLARRLFEQLAGDETDAVASARAVVMSALAAFKDGDRAMAIARWTEVAKTRPLSWPALISRARLAAAGAPVPPAMEVSSSSTPSQPLEVALPPPVDLLHHVGLDSDAEAALRDREPLVSVHASAGRSLEALCAAYGTIGRAKRRYQLALQIPAPLLASAPSAATRWAWDCAYAKPFEQEILARETSERLPSSLTYSVIRQESNYVADAVSPAHAVGLMQLLPETGSVVAASMKLPFDESRLTDPVYNLTLGTRYLHDLVEHFKGQLPLAVAAYNIGVESIVRWMGRAPGMEIDSFVERIPDAETRTYVARVMGNYARYEYLRHGEQGVPTVSLAISD